MGPGRLPGVGELNYSKSVESPHRFGSAEEKSTPKRAANPDVHATGCWLAGVA